MTTTTIILGILLSMLATPIIMIGVALVVLVLVFVVVMNIIGKIWDIFN